MKAFVRIYELKDEYFDSGKMKFERLKDGDAYSQHKLGSANTARIDNRLSESNMIDLAFEVFSKRKTSKTDGFDIVVTPNIRYWDNGKVIFKHNLFNEEL